MGTKQVMFYVCEQCEKETREEVKGGFILTQGDLVIESSGGDAVLSSGQYFCSISCLGKYLSDGLYPPICEMAGEEN